MELQLKIYKLHFTSPLHIGSVREDYGTSQTTISSDAMYAALTACLAKLGKDIPANGDLGCTISSLFPFYQIDKQTDAILFLPKPLQAQVRAKGPTKLKEYKKVCWLEQSAFNQTINGGDPFDTYAICGKYLMKQDMSFGVEYDKKPYSDFVVSQVSERVAIPDRTGHEDAVPFYMDRVSFRDYSGLYFVADGDCALLDETLELLALEGIGTDRNVGNGFFEYETSSITLDLPKDANHVVALSSFIPESKEQLEAMLKSDKAAYELQRRGGWITTYPNQSLRKNVIYMLSAGSVFGYQADSVISLGKIVDLRPDLPEVKHPIWRNGKALFLPIKL